MIGSVPSGVAMSKARPICTPRKSRCETPMIVKGWPSSSNRLADHIGAAAVFALPESVTEDRDRPVRTAAAPIVVGGEQAADLRRDAERVEEAAADEESLRVARLAAGIQVEARVAVGADADQHLLVIADVFPYADW